MNGTFRNFASRALLLLLFVPALSLAATGVHDAITTRCLREEVELSGLEVSPDGARLVVTATRSDFDANRHLSELLLIDTSTGAARSLSTRQDIYDVSWSPNGDQIAFLADAEGLSQIFVLPLSGGEPRQVTRSKGGLLHFTWRPDGKAFALIANEDPVAKTGTDRFNDSFEVGSNDYLTRTAASRNYAGYIEASGGEVIRWTQPGTTVATEFYNSSLSWSSDGSAVAVTVYPSSRSGDSDLGKNYLLNVKSSKLEPLTQNSSKEGPAYFLPGSKRKIVYFYPRDGIPANLTEVYSATEGGAAKSETRVLDREILDFGWLPDGRLVLTGYDGVQSAIWTQQSDSSFAKLNIGDTSEVYELSVSNSGSIAWIGSEPYRPAEVYVLQKGSSEPRRLTDLNRALAEHPQGKSEELDWNTTAGNTDGVVTYPPNFNPHAKYPLVLLIHGGPTYASTLAFNMTAQLMANKGWIVLQPNYRGSNHRGNAFQSAIANDAGEGPGSDVMAGVEKLKRQPFVDGTRVAVSGWSYGGWMTAWLIGRYPEAWAAAVAGAAPVDYTDMFSLSDLNRMPRHAITASPYTGDNLRGAQDQSPLKNLSKIKAPTLVLSKSNDTRVSITGSYKLFNALRDNGVKTQFIVYPGEGHLVTDPVRAQDVYDRWLAWFAENLGSGVK